VIYRERGDLVAECEECGETTEGDIRGERVFLAFVAELKDRGWKIRNEDGDWLHYCPDCEVDP
jgi:hypothetical protein